MKFDSSRGRRIPAGSPPLFWSALVVSFVDLCTRKRTWTAAPGWRTKKDVFGPIHLPHWECDSRFSRVLRIMAAVCSRTRVVIEFNVHRPAHRNSLRDYHLFVNHLHKENRIQWINLAQRSLLCKEQKDVMLYWENLHCSLHYCSVLVPWCKDSCNTNQRRDQHSGDSIGDKCTWQWSCFQGEKAWKEQQCEEMIQRLLLIHKCSILPTENTSWWNECNI